MEKRISMLKHQSTPASPEFQDGLKSKLLQARARQSMTQSRWSLALRGFFDRFSMKQVTFAVSMVVLVAVIGTTLIFRPAGPGGTPLGPLASLLISPAHAMDNFELKPVVSDSTGVSGDTAYLLTSKEPVDLSLLKQHLTVEPAVAYVIDEKSATEWEIRPEAELPANTLFKVKIATAYVGEDGQTRERDYAWAYQVKDRFKVLTSIPRDAATYVPTDTGIEVTFSHPNLANLENHFSIEPKIAGRFEYHGRTAVFVPTERLKEGTVYAVTVSKGLGLTGSEETLADDYLMRFETSGATRGWDDRKPWISVADDLHDFGPDDVPAMRVDLSNVPDEKVEVSLYAFASADAYLEALRSRDKLPWWSYGRSAYAQDVSKLERVLTFGAVAEKIDYNNVIRFPEKLKTGWYVAEFSVPGAVKDQVWIQVSELATYVSAAKDRILIWTNSVKSKAPVAGASVELLGYGVSSGTDGDGLASLVTPATFAKDASDEKKSERPYLRVRSGQATVIVPMADSGRVIYSSIASDDRTDEYWRYFYTDRPRYQPNDMIRYWGLLKERKDGRAPQGPVTISFLKEGYVDYYYQPIRISEFEVTPDANGLFNGEIPVNNLRPDYYAIEIKIGDQLVNRHYVEIRGYVKPAYFLTVRPDKLNVFAGDPVSFEVKAAFFEGTPVPNLKLAVEHQDGPKETVTTDASGKATFKMTYPYVVDEYYGWPRYKYVNVRPENAEIADIQVGTSVTVYGPAVYGTTEIKYPEKGVAEIKTRVRKIDLAGLEDQNWAEDRLGREPAAGSRVEGSVKKITYRRIDEGTYYDFVSKHTYQKYRYEREEQVVDLFKGTAGADGFYVYRRAVEPETSYQVEMKLYDDKGRYDLSTQYLWYYDGQYVSKYAGEESSYYHIELNKNDGLYSLGEGVEATFMRNDKPVEGTSGKVFLFAQYQNGLQEYRVQSTPRYQFTFEEKDIPNIMLGGVWFTGASYVTVDPSQYYWDWGGGTTVAFKNTDRNLTIETEMDRPSYRPGEEASMIVKVKDKDGKPMQASVNLNLVDEAYYAAVGGGGGGDLRASLYAGVRPGVLFTRKTHESKETAFGLGAEFGCFAAGTMITMADGSKKAIEEIKVGDQILTLETPMSLVKSVGKVSKTFRHIVGGHLLVNGSLKVTPEHRVFASGRFMMAGELKAGDWMLRQDGSRLTVKTIEDVKGIVEVFNFTVDPYHTYFADGLYVHNDKGGGAAGAQVRERFEDTALFRIIETDGTGTAKVSFTLPDNLTSWRVTAQAVTGGLYAGTGQAKIPVSLPVFIDASVGGEYLADDKVVARARAYGTALVDSDETTFTVSAPSLGLSESKEAKAKAFAAVDLILPGLKLGRHDITYTLKTAKGNDAVKLPMDVISSRLVRQEVIQSEKLTTATRLSDTGGEMAVAVFADQGQNQLYRPLQWLSWGYGDRVDQALSRKEARELLNKYYGEEFTIPEFSASNYQLQNGISLLPYSSADLELTARLAAAAPEEFDTHFMRQTFFAKLDAKNSTPEEVTLSLYGLAALGEPVLPRLVVWQAREDLPLKQRLYLALAAEAIGAGELARSMWENSVQPKIDISGNQAWVKMSGVEDENAEATALAALLAGALDLPERDLLRQFVAEHPPKEVLLNLEELAYAKKVLPKLKPSPASFSYMLGGKKETVSITGGQHHAVHLEPSQLADFRAESVTGDVGVSVRVTRPIQTATTARKDISIRREYLVNGKTTDDFKDGDIVEVRLYPTVSKENPQKEFQVTDLLPSGLLPISAPYSYWSDYTAYWPYGGEGQRLVFRYYPGGSWRYSDACQAECFRYFARVKTKGTYKAEPAMIQAFLDPETIAFSNEETLTIE